MISSGLKTCDDCQQLQVLTREDFAARRKAAENAKKAIFLFQL